MKPCECATPGFCSRFNRKMSSRYWQYCQGTSGLSREQEEKYISSMLDRDNSILDKGTGFLSAVTRRVSHGFAPLSLPVVEARLAVCSDCEQKEGIKTDRSDWKCKACGCYLHKIPLVGLQGKAHWSSEDCPLGKWPAAQKNESAESGCNCGGK